MGIEGSKKARIRKACDSCNVKRTKCDGNSPCGHCEHLKIDCTYLRKEQKRGRASANYPKEIKSRKLKKGVEACRGKGEAAAAARDEISGYPVSFPIVSYNEVGRNPEFRLGQTEFPILRTIAEDLVKVGISFETADELFRQYFGEVFKPSSKVFSILRGPTMLKSLRPTQPNLLLAMMLSVAVQIDVKSFAGSGRDFATRRLYQLIKDKFPPRASQFTLDDFIVIVHLGFLMPWLSYPNDSLFWLALGNQVALHLRVNTDDPADDEGLKEEKRRAWWSFFIFDKLTALCFNERSLIDDDRCLQTYLPCDEDLWQRTAADIAPAESSHRKQSIHYDHLDCGIYGWFLPISKLFVHVINNKNLRYSSKVVDEKLKAAYEAELKGNINTILRTIEARQAAVCPSKHANFCRDLLYAKFILLVLELVLDGITDWECLFQFDFVSTDIQDQRFDDCVAILEELLKYDENMREYPFIMSFFLFLIGIILLSILNSITSDDGTNINKINKMKYDVKILVKVMEAVIIIHPCEFLKIVRNYLLWSVKDCENLIFLSDYVDQFKENALKRKDAISAYSWGKNGHGIAI